MWFVKVKGASIAKETTTDDYSNTIVAGLEYVTGQFLEKIEWGTKGSFYKLNQKNTYFFKE